MEDLIMFITHIFKTIHYFAVEGFPVVTLEMLPEAFEAIAYNLATILSMYVSYMFI